MILIPLIYLAAVLETWLAADLAIAGVAPDLLAVAAFVWLSRCRGQYSPVIGGLVGLIRDLSSAGPLGVGITAFAIGAYWLDSMQRRANLDAPLPRWLAIWFAITITAGIQLAIGRILREIDLPLLTLGSHAFLVGLYTACIACPVVMMVSWSRERARRGPLTIEG